MITKETKTIVTFKEDDKELTTINKMINRLIKVISDDVFVNGTNDIYEISFVKQSHLKQYLILDINIENNKITNYHMDKREFSVKERARIKRIIKDYLWLQVN